MIETLPLLLTLTATAFLGSWHCGVMCGPIAVALGRKGSLWPYHLGRGLAYVSAGVLAGFFGEGLLHSPSNEVRVMGAVLFAVFFAVNLVAPARWEAWLPKFVHTPYQRLAKFRPGIFAFGLMSVLLPCGWLWTYLVAAATTGSPGSGALVMFILWLSSCPALSAVHLYFKSQLARESRTSLAARWVPRGLSLAGFYALFSHFLGH